MKKLFKLLIFIIVVGGSFLLLTNETFIFTSYKDIITIPRFMYLYKENFYTTINKDSINKSKDEYLNKLEACYDKYYYDKENNITITKYEVSDKKYYRKVSILYEEKNYCDSNYVLSDMWVYEYINLSGYVKGDITEASMSKLIDKIYNSKRVDNLDFDASGINISVDCDKNEGSYNLTFKSMGDKYLLVIKSEGNSKKFAVYEVEDVKNYLRSLM